MSSPQATERGIQAEMALLRARYCEIALGAVHWLERKYRRSDQLEETLRRCSPHVYRRQKRGRDAP
jgi:hypothetical protein